MNIPSDLTAWIEGRGIEVGIPGTTDPGEVNPPCLFAGLPTLTARTLPEATLDVPVYLVAAGEGAPANAQLLTYLVETSRALNVPAAEPTTLTVGGVDYHAYLFRPRIQITE